jgi:hypothetical protein
MIANRRRRFRFGLKLLLLMLTLFCVAVAYPLGWIYQRHALFRGRFEDQIVAVNTAECAPFPLNLFGEPGYITICVTSDDAVLAERIRRLFPEAIIVVVDRDAFLDEG